MEWNEKLQLIIDYVENHLQRKQEPIEQQEIAGIADCSFGFFQKVFSYMNGISFSDYIRCRKLTLAGYDLKSTDKRVVDISYQYGYDSPTSFTKAFHQFHGVTPKEARNREVKLRAMPKMQISIKQQYSWSMTHKGTFRLVGKSMPCSHEELPSKILEFWSDCQKNGVFSTLVSMDKGSPNGLFGLFLCDSKKQDKMEYSIMTAADGELPDGYCEMVIPEATWAVFDCVGPVPQAIRDGWKYLHEEWLVKYPFQHAACPELEWYSDGNAYAEDYLSQIWIPVIDKRQ